MARVAAARTVSAGGLYGFLWDREVERMQWWGGVESGYPMGRLEGFRAGRSVEFPDWDVPDWARPKRRQPGFGLRVVVSADDSVVSRDETAEEWLEDRRLSIGDDPRGHEFWARPQSWDRRADNASSKGEKGQAMRFVKKGRGL